MATNNNASNKSKRSIENKLDKLTNNLDGLFADNYASDPANRQEIDRISGSIYNKIDNILSKNSIVQDVPSITHLYTRMQKEKNGNTKTSEEIFSGMDEIIGNNNLNAMIINNPDLNRYIQVKDLQVDMVLKYMPKLMEALNLKKDNVLSADSFNKDFVFATNKSSSGTEKSIQFTQRLKELKEKYNIEDLFDEIYDDTAKYGEYFLYTVPYQKAISQLMSSKNPSAGAFIESTSIVESGRFLEKDDEYSKNNILNSDVNINISFNPRGIITEAILNTEKASSILKNNNGKSLKEQFLNEASSGIKIDQIMDDDLDYEKLYTSSNDGLITKEKDIGAIKQIPGCVVRKIERKNIIPIYVENICLGYYYLNINTGTDDIDRNKALITNSLDKSVSDSMMDENDVLIKYIANKISNTIDSKFINNNQDLKEEIYVMLKYNENYNIQRDSLNINVTYLPPEDVHHFYFALDKTTHRGISDLDRALTPAMFWCLLELSTTIGIVTRSQDKRIFYVKQNVETNVARTLLNVINQLKKGNMGIRQMESMNNILGIVGKYNDHVIPMGQSGDAPIQFEVMQGQNIETPTELMGKYEENAINATDVPLELVNNSDNIDFAIKYTMSNSKFLRKVFKRQAICQRKFGSIITNIYNYEYIEIDELEVQLPPPAFLAMTNMSQLLNNTRDYVQALADLEYSGSDADDDEKAEFIKIMVKAMLPTYIDIESIDKYKGQAKVNIASAKSTIDTNAESEDNSDSYRSNSSNSYDDM